MKLRLDILCAGFVALGLAACASGPKGIRFTDGTGPSSPDACSVATTVADTQGGCEGRFARSDRFALGPGPLQADEKASPKAGDPPTT